jgi:GH24 family phage-related lysozyme (muramidase)
MDAVTFLKKYEGFTPTAIWDVNAYRIGFGSDTITNNAGDVRKVLQTDKITIQDADRDLNRRIETEFIPKIKNKIGSGNWNKLNTGTRTALISLAYNYGNITKTAIITAIKNNDKNLSQIWIDSTYNDNKSLPEKVRNALRKRRLAESILISNEKKNSFFLPIILILAGVTYLTIKK